MICPKCSSECHRDSVDVGVGIIYGPYGCPSCGWSEYPEYDLSDGQSPVNEKGGVIDQYGGYYPPKSSVALTYALSNSFEAPDEN